MSTDIKLRKAQLSKIIQSVGSFGFWLSNLGKKKILNYGVPFTRDNFPGLVSSITSNAASNRINKLEEEQVEKKL